MHLDFFIQCEKVVNPCTRVTFFGSLIDTILKRNGLPQDKLEHLLSLTASCAARTKLTKKELQIIAGHMFFAARAFYGARVGLLGYLLTILHVWNLLPIVSEPQVLLAKNIFGGKPARVISTVWVTLHLDRKNILLISSGASFNGFGAIMGHTQPVLLPLVFSQTGWHLRSLDHCLQQNMTFLEFVSACLTRLIWGKHFQLRKSSDFCRQYPNGCLPQSWLHKTFVCIKWFRLVLIIFLSMNLAFMQFILHGSAMSRQMRLVAYLQNSSHTTWFTGTDTFPGARFPTNYFRRNPAQLAWKASPKTTDHQSGKYLQKIMVEALCHILSRLVPTGITGSAGCSVQIYRLFVSWKT